MEINMTITPIVNIGEVFYSVDLCGERITAHKCTRIVISFDLSMKDPEISYVANGYRFDACSVYASFDAASAALKEL